MKVKDIKQSVQFKASPHDVYEALMDSKKHALFTGGEAEISRKVGGKFTAYDDYIEGINRELVTDARIVQSWRASDWPEGHYSQVSFSITKTDNGSKLLFSQIGVQEEQYEAIKQGWVDFYWAPMKKMFAEQQ
jgi:activator of HSP90 ATPase